MGLAEYSRRGLLEKLDIESNSKRYDDNMQLSVGGQRSLSKDVVTYKEKLLSVVEDVGVVDGVVSPCLEEPCNFSRAGRTSSFTADTFIYPIVNINIDDINDLHFLRNTISCFTFISQIRLYLSFHSTTVIKPLTYYSSDSDSTNWGDFSSDSD